MTTEEKITSLNKIKEELKSELEEIELLKLEYNKSLDISRNNKNDIEYKIFMLKVLYYRLKVSKFIYNIFNRNYIVKDNNINDNLDDFNLDLIRYTKQTECIIKSINYVENKIDDLYNELRIIEKYIELVLLLESPILNNSLFIDYNLDINKEVEEYILKKSIK